MAYNTGGVPVNTLYNQTIPSITSTVQGMNTSAPTQSRGGFGSLVNSAVSAYNTLNQPTVDPSNPYGLYQAPGYVQGQVTQGATPYYAPSQTATGERSTAFSPERATTGPVAQPTERGTDYYTQRAAALAQQQQEQLRASGAAPTWGTGKNADIYNQYVASIQAGNSYDPYDEQSFRNYAQAVTGSGALPSERTTYAARTAPVTVNPQTIINSNQGLHEIWMQQTRPANPLDVNSFAKWAAQNGYPTLAGESSQDQYAAYKAAKAAGTAPVAPTQMTPAPTALTAPAAAPVQPVQQTPAPQTQPAPAPIATPTFASTGAVKLPTGTVTPTQTGYTASRAQAPTGPSRPGYTAPSGRVYANWTPRRKVT